MGRRLNDMAGAANDTAAQRVELEQSFADGVSNVCRRSPPSHTRTHTLPQVLSPLIAQHTEAVFAVQQSQAALSTSVDALKAKLEDSLPYSQLPQVGAYLQKLSEMKRRIATLSATLNRTNDRLVRTERFAQAQYGTLKACNDQRQVCSEPQHTPTHTHLPVTECCQRLVEYDRGRCSRCCLLRTHTRHTRRPPCHRGRVRERCRGRGRCKQRVTL